MFEFQKQEELAEFLARHNIDPHSEAAYLYSFAFVAGGWTDVTPESLRTEYHCHSLQDCLERDFTGFEAYYTRHSHRKVEASYVAETLSELANLSVDGVDCSTFQVFFEELYNIKEETGSNTAAFDAALEAVQEIAHFRRLSAFDWLEFVIRVQNHDWLVPTQLKRTYLEDNYPEEGYELVFDEPLSGQTTREHLQLLHSYATKELQLSAIEAIFDIESCLCELYKDYQDDSREFVLADGDSPIDEPE